MRKNNLTIALNVSYAKKEKIYPAYVSKHNSDREKQVVLLMILNEEKWYYLAVKKLSALLRGLSSTNIMVIFIVLIDVILFQQKKKLELHKKVCEKKRFLQCHYAF